MISPHPDRHRTVAEGARWGKKTKLHCAMRWVPVDSDSDMRLRAECSRAPAADEAAMRWNSREPGVAEGRPDRVLSDQVGAVRTERIEWDRAPCGHYTFWAEATDSAGGHEPCNFEVVLTIDGLAQRQLFPGITEGGTEQWVFELEARGKGKWRLWNSKSSSSSKSTLLGKAHTAS